MTTALCLSLVKQDDGGGTWLHFNAEIVARMLISRELQHLCSEAKTRNEIKQEGIQI